MFASYRTVQVARWTSAKHNSNESQWTNKLFNYDHHFVAFIARKLSFVSMELFLIEMKQRGMNEKKEDNSSVLPA